MKHGGTQDEYCRECQWELTICSCTNIHEMIHKFFNRVQEMKVESVIRKKREHLSYIMPRSNIYSRQLVKMNLKGKKKLKSVAIELQE